MKAKDKIRSEFETAIHELQDSYALRKSLYEKSLADHHQFEVNLVKKEALLEKAEEIAKFGSWQLMTNDWRIFLSKGAARIFGLPQHEDTIENIQKAVLPQYRKSLDKALSDLIKMGSPYNVEFRILRESDGEIIDIHSVAEYDSINNTIFGTIHDITERKFIEEELRRSETETKRAQQHTHIGCFSIDLATNQVTWTDELFKMYGLDPTLPVPPLNESQNLFTPESWDLLSSSISNTVETGVPYEIELKTLRNDGRNGWMWARGETIKDSDGKAIQLWGVVQDITLRKQSELLLMESEERLFAAQEVAKVGSWETNLSSLEVIWSEETYRIFEIDHNLFKSSHPDFMNYVHPDDKEKVDSAFIVSFGSTSVNSIQHRIITPSGSIKYLEERWRIKFNKEGKAEKALGTCRDLTEHKRIEDALSDSEEKFRSIVENARDGILFTEPNGIINFANKAACKILGRDEDELKMFGRDLVMDSEDKRIPLAIAERKNTGQFYGELNFVRKDGTVFPVDLSSTVYRDTFGKERASIIFNDISERKMNELELKIAKDKAEESDRLKSAFLANMSHEIRTPMNGILGFAELLKEPNLTGEQQADYIKIIEKSGNRMLGIINNIIDISKIESGLMGVNHVECDIDEQMEYVYTFFKPEIINKKLLFKLQKSSLFKEVRIKTDKEKFLGILINLLKNAIKYTDNGSIEFGYEIKGNNLEFFVKDTGIGIPKNRQVVIFERFMQADIEDKHAFQGAGLGLSISKAFVKLLGGEIWVESEEGIGSSFYFTIPYVPNAEQHRVTDFDKND